MILYGYRNPQTFQRCKGTTFFETSKSFLKKNFTIYNRYQSCIVCLDNTRALFCLFSPPCIVCLDNTRLLFYLFRPSTIVCLDNSRPFFCLFRPPTIVCLDNSCRPQIKNFHLWSESFCEISRINVLFFFGKIVCRQDKIRNTCIDRKGRDKGTHKRKGYGQRINPYNFRGFKFFINSFFCAKNSHKL